MELKEFIENFMDQFDEVDVNEISENTKFHELEDWTSLVALSVMAMVDEEYDVALTGEEMRKAETIGDLYNLVVSKL